MTLSHGGGRISLPLPLSHRIIFDPSLLTGWGYYLHFQTAPWQVALAAAALHAATHSNKHAVAIQPDDRAVALGHIVFPRVQLGLLFTFRRRRTTIRLEQQGPRLEQLTPPDPVGTHLQDQVVRSRQVRSKCGGTRRFRSRSLKLCDILDNQAARHT